MDRIEDETVRILYFLQAGEPMRPAAPVREAPEEEEGGELVVAATREQRRISESSVQDFTRNIQRKKQKELDELQFVGGGGAATAQQPVVRGRKVGRNEPCPCGSGKKYKKCCGA